MKKLLLTLTITVAAITTALAGLGFTPNYLYNAPEVATGIGARLACSMRYVLNQDKPQIAADIKVYSPLLSLLDYEFDEQQQTATAGLGLYKRTASYIPKVGCDLDYAGFERSQYQFQDITIDEQAAWPLGNSVTTHNADIQQKLDILLAEDNELGNDTRALLIVHQGQIIAESYALGYSADSLFLGWSMSKTVTGLLAGQLALQGKFDVDERNLFPQWQDERQNISLRQLMNMTDGLDYEELYEPGGSAPAMLFQSADSVEYMKTLPLLRTPGEHYRYSSGSTNLVMDIVMQRYGKTREQAIANIAEQFFKPMALSPVVFEVDAAGLLMGSSYMYTTARNWAKLGQLMLNKGEINGTRLVSEQWVQDSTAHNDAQNRGDYGYFWWLNSTKEHARWPSMNPNIYSAMGSRDQRVTVIPDQELVIVRLGWSPKKYRDDENFVTISGWFN